MILLFGMPRSGTSWLGKIFDSHPRTLYRHEPDKAYVHPEVPPLLPPSAVAERRRALETFVEEALAIRTVGVVGKLPVFPKSYHSPLQHRLKKLLVLGAKLWSRSFGEVSVPDMVDAARRDVRIVWKSVVSLGRLGALARALPESRAVLILRHPCGQIASLLRGEAAGAFETKRPASEYYRVLEMLAATRQARAHGLTLEHLRRLGPIERLAWQWTLNNEIALADIAGLPGCTALRYEDLCAEPLGTMRRLFEHVGLEWHPQTERFIRESVGGEEDGYYSIVKDPSRAASRWREELAAEDVERILAITARSPAGRFFADAPEAEREDGAERASA